MAPPHSGENQHWVTERKGEGFFVCFFYLRKYRKWEVQWAGLKKAEQLNKNSFRPGVWGCGELRGQTWSHCTVEGLEVLLLPRQQGPEPEGPRGGPCYSLIGLRIFWVSKEPAASAGQGATYRP